MPLALSIAVRFLLGGRNRYARFITWVSVTGLGLGVLVLSVVVSVMNGFGAELRARILGTVPHVLASPGDPALLELPAAGQGVRHAYRLFRASGMATWNGAMAPVAIFAIDPEGARSLPQIGGNMVSGDLPAALAQPGGAALGWPLAYHLGLIPGDDFLLVVAQPAAGGVRPQLKRFRLAATFEMGADFDRSLIIVARSAFSEQERRFMGTDGMRLDLEDPADAEPFAAALRSRFPHLQVETWTQTYGALFQAVKIEKALMFLILLLVVAVAGFNIVSGQSMLADDKRAEIAILRSMGAGDGLVLRVFLLQGVAIATAGILVGLVLGALVAANIGDLVATLESWLGFRMLEGSYFFILPSLVLPRDLALIGGLSWLLCLLAAWLPARRAVRQDPLAGLH